MKKISEIRIRNVNAAAIARIDQLVEKSTFRSRNEFLKHYIESLAVLQELKDQENRTAALIGNITDIISYQTALLETIKLQIERLEKKNNE